MSSRLAADRRIRAAALPVAGLDIRGPVSQALARAGVAVPSAPLADAAGETAVAPSAAPSPTISRSRGARRVLKPFAESPWPTSKPRAAAPEPPTVLSGLTADERRVHRILLDTLAMQNDQGYGAGVVGLSYAEKRSLPVLDLTFIDAEIAKMDRKGEWGSRNVPAIVGTSAAALLAAGFLLVGDTDMATAFAVVALIMACVIGLLAPFGGPVFAPSSTTRRRIYDALRELALLADPEAVTSDALRQADAVIDRLAGADAGPRLGPLPNAPAPTASGPALRPRVRS